ncbi:MAG: hypothetical protein HY652_12065 [Acidobacteria bacterium]|nr:hypothetical protein [Acidobacteriota bacterium]
MSLAALLGCSAQRQEAEFQSKYMAPRFPSYFKDINSVEDLMPYVRTLVRAKVGFQGKGLGEAGPGDTVALIVPSTAEDMVIEAIHRAYDERKVKAEIVWYHDLVGVTREQALALDKARRPYTAEKGFMEAANWINGVFADRNVPKQWLKERRPDLYSELFPPSSELSKELEEVANKMERREFARKLREYIERHPNVRGIFWGQGGSTGLRRSLYPHDKKLLGLFTYTNRYEVMSKISSFPGDVWALVEERTIEPLGWIDRFEATDPEGTQLVTDLTEDQADRWNRGSYQRGHLYMFPNQATGRFPYSFVEYPAQESKWVSRSPMALPSGVIAGTHSGSGLIPRIEVHFKNGYITDVKGGGVYGEAWREFLKYPKLNELTFPFHQERGFWYLYECAWGSRPKDFRNPFYLERGSIGPERMRAGVIHWGFGLRLWHDPDKPVESPSWIKFSKDNNTPDDHGWHIKTYFSTYKVRVRGTDKWLTLMDGGHMTALDSPEVRALASRYGDADAVLAEEWIPHIPGINVPGKYEDYARDPWKTVSAVFERIKNGTYEYFYPPVAKKTG